MLNVDSLIDKILLQSAKTVALAQWSPQREYI